MKRLTITYLIILINLSVAGHNLVAAPSGTPSADGTLASPLDIQTALKRLQPSDSLFLRGGTYYLAQTLTIHAPGSVTHNTYIGAFADERPIWDFRQQPHYKNGVTLSSDRVHLRGITICYAGYKGIICTASNCILEGLDVYGCCDSGIQMKGGHSNLITDCDSHDNFDYTTAQADTSDFGGNADGFADKQYTGTPGNIYVRCRAWGNSDDGWDFFQRVGGTTLLIQCECRSNGPQWYDLSHHPRRQTDSDFLNGFDGEGKILTFRGGKKPVVCTLTHFINNGNGNGFKLGGANTQHDVELRNCLSMGNTVKGFDQNSNAGRMTLLDCIAEDNGKNFGFYKDNGYTLHIEGCHSLGSRTADTFHGGSISQERNSWNK